MKKRIFAFLMISMLLLAATPASAEMDRADWYLGIYGGWILLDSDRHSHDDTNAGFGFGYFLKPNISIDLEFESYNTHYDREYLDERGLFGWAGENRVKDLQFTGRYYFRDDGLMPYVSMGVGIQRHRNVFHNGEDSSVSLGVGARYAFGRYMAARLNGYYKVAFDDNTIAGESSLSDVIFRLDVIFHFGEH